MKLNNLTFVIFTFNEEKRIERVIKNFQKYGEVLLADNKSTDNTIEIARRYGCKVFTREKEYEYVENQELVDLLYDQISTEWLYFGFADEMLDQKTLIEIQKIIATNRYEVISIDRKNYFYGQFCHDAFNARTNKIFKKHAIDFTDNPIHGFGKCIVPSEKVYYLEGAFFVHHFISNTAASYLNVINRYTETEMRFGYTEKKGLWYPLALVGYYFLKQYILKKGYKAGFAGLSLTLLMIFYAFVKNMKVYEKNHDLSTATIEEANDKHRDLILENMA